MSCEGLKYSVQWIQLLHNNIAIVQLSKRLSDNKIKTSKTNLKAVSCNNYMIKNLNIVPL